MGVDEFIAYWAGREGGAERANYSLFLTQLTAALDLPPPQPAPSDYRFEFPVRANTTQPLRIDLYKRGCFILEAKQSRLDPAKGEAAPVQDDLFGAASATPRRRPRWDADMRAAFNQAWDYASRLPADHDRPPFLITCDVGRSFEFYADFTGQGRAYRAFPDERSRVVALTDLADPRVQDRFRAIWTAPATLDPALRRAEATREVAAHLAEVSRALEKRGHPPEEVATFLTRTLFAMFAEDVGLLPQDSFKGLLQRCLESPGTFAPQAEDLFGRMDEGGFSPALNTMVRRFNGAFYKDRRAFPLEKEEIGALLAAAGKDWRDVEPAIFGTLLEQALTPSDRSRLGAHYTPRPYVERLVQATVIEPLRADWDAARAAAEDKQARGDKAGAALELLAFHDQLTRTRVLDPACGTGNFLYVTLELMKALESEVLEARAGLIEAEDEDLIPAEVKRGVDPRQFWGLELNPRAAAIAELVLWIGYLQASFRRDPDYRPRDPVLADYETINPPISGRGGRKERCVDAILQSDGPVIGGGGDAYPRPRRPPWPEAEFIVGNPPFTGGKDIRAEQGDAYAEALWAVNPRLNASADLVMYWWDRAADILTRKGSKLRRFGLVTTNSISQVFQRRVVAPWLSAANANKQAASLVFAVDDHPWTKATRDAAAVRIAMTVAEAGAREGELASVVREARLDTDQPEVELSIARGVVNADLTVGVDVTRANPLQANRGLCVNGMKPLGAGFIITRAEAEHLGLGRRPGLEQHIRPYRNGRDLAGRSRGVFAIDLWGMSAEDVRASFPEVYQHLALTVRVEREAAAKRSKTRDAQEYAERWWTFCKPRQELRAASQGLNRQIVTVQTAKHRLFQFLPSELMPDQKLMVISLDDAAYLAVMSSNVHCGWTSKTCSWLGVGNDSVYVKVRSFDPFPFPAWSEANHVALAAAGERLDAFRKARLAEHPELTLTRLYNALEAHRAGRPLTAEEAADFDRGSVLVLAELHAEIDALTLAAYGWPESLTGEPLLAALVALNAERAAEEARGQVRWLRPDYQGPRFARAEVAGPEQAGDLLGPAAAVPAGRLRWPPDPRAQVLLIKGALADAPAPLTLDALAARFQGRRPAADVRRLIAVLQRDGQVRRGADGGFSLLRAA
jgi:hypothetical protein